MLLICKAQDGVVLYGLVRAYFLKMEMRLILLVFFPKIKNLVAKTLFMYYDKVHSVGIVCPMQTMMKRRLDNHELC